MDVKCQVKVSHLTLGNREGHEEQKTYREGDTLTIPLSLAKALGNSVKIVAELQKQKEKRIREK